MTFQLLLDLFSTGQKIRAEIVKGFPHDAVIVRHHYENGLYFITVQHESFEPVKQGDPIPIQNIEVKTLALPATVEESVAGPTLRVHGIVVKSWFGTDYNETAHELAKRINLASVDREPAIDLDAIAAEEVIRAETAGADGPQLVKQERAAAA